MQHNKEQRDDNINANEYVQTDIQARIDIINSLFRAARMQKAKRRMFKAIIIYFSLMAIYFITICILWSINIINIFIFPNYVIYGILSTPVFLVISDIIIFRNVNKDTISVETKKKLLEEVKKEKENEDTA